MSQSPDWSPSDASEGINTQTNTLTHKDSKFYSSVKLIYTVCFLQVPQASCQVHTLLPCSKCVMTIVGIDDPITAEQTQNLFWDEKSRPPHNNLSCSRKQTSCDPCVVLWRHLLNLKRSNTRSAFRRQLLFVVVIFLFLFRLLSHFQFFFHLAH